MINLLANSLWYLLCLPGSVAFRRALGNVAATQQNLLLRLLRRNAATAIGRRYGFANLRSIADYQARVPLSTYQNYREAIDRIGAGEPNVLTRDPVLMLEPTSGSTAATKLIPYTAGLKAEFQRAIAPWITDLYRHNPHLLQGQAYWSITPVTHRQQRTSGGLPLGFEEDSEYFGAVQQYLIRRMMAVPPLVKLIHAMPTFRYVTLLFLLRSQSLSLISVWNPTFLTLLVQPLADWWPQLVEDIWHGTLSPPEPLPADLAKSLKAWNSPHPHRAAEVAAAFQQNDTPAAIHVQLWPQLRLISCWAEAQAAVHVPQIAQLFPQARIQGKGLLATEGVISFPLEGQPGHALALRSHFFEFLPVEAQSDPLRLAHQLERGRDYEVVLTTGGGLYRYRLRDVVRVVGHLGQCPLIEFVGKAGHVSDRFGEKLNEYHVRQALEGLFERYAFRPNFAMLAFEDDTQPPAYTLFIEIHKVTDSFLQQLGAALETALQKNFHYRYCRNLQQLGPLRVFRINGDALETYLATCRAHGQRAGDIKPVTLHLRAGWSQIFRGKQL